MDEVFTIVGLRPYRFKDDKTGRTIEGVTIHAVNSSPYDDGVIGSLTEKFSVNNDCIKALLLDAGTADLGDVVGVSVEPVYNKRGRVRQLDVVHDNR